ncbi:MAG: tail fiber domain-containing protein [Kiritimatiellia bacterium]
MKIPAMLMSGLSILLLLASPARAQQVPGLINAQGRLFDGEKLLSGEIQMVLRLFDQPTGGELLYEDTAVVNVVDGVYSTFLGDNTTFGSLPTALSKGPAYLEVTANGTTYAPRERIASVAYSLVSDGVRRAGVTAEMLGPNSVTADAIANGAVTAGKIATNSVGSAVIVDGSVLESDIADGAVTPPKLSQSYWTTSGNITEGGKVVFLGTVDNRPFDIRANNLRILRLEPTADSPNLIGGHEVNDAAPGTIGAVIGGGGQPNLPNRVKAEFGVVGGGADNLASGAHAVISGGLSNAASGSRSTGGGGRGNLAVGAGGTIAGGFSNLVTQSYAEIAGGYANRAEGYVSAIGGGWGNSATGMVSVVAGGQENTALGAASVISGGWMNRATGYGTVVAGGRTNAAEGEYASIGGGTNNFVTGSFAVIPGGAGNLASGKGSFAAGMNAKASHDGVFAWSGGGNGDLVSTAPGQFLIRAPGNVGIDTDHPDQKLTVGGKVKASGFVGNGAEITGVIADNVIPGSLGNDALKADAAIAPAKIAGVALTRETEFGGSLQGRFDQIVLRPGSVSLTELKPGLIEQVIADSDLVLQVKALKEKSLTAEAALGGALTGTLANAALARGSVGAEQLQPGVVEKIIAASPVSTEVARLGAAFLPAGTVFAGDVSGAATNLVLRAGSVSIDKLAPDAVKALGGAAELAAELKAHRDEALTYRTEFKGDIVGKGSELKLAPGSVRAENLAPGVIEGVIAASPVSAALKTLDEAKLNRNTVFAGDVEGPADKLALRPGSVGAEHLQPGLLIKAIQGSDLAAQIAGLQGKVVTVETPAGGDVTGTLGAIKLVPEAVIKAAGIEEFTARVAGLEKKIADSQSAGTAAQQKAETERRELLEQVVGAMKGALNADSAFKGDVTGTAGALKIAEGAVTEASLSKELLAKIGGGAAVEAKLSELAGAIDARLGELGGEFLAKNAEFAGDVKGPAGALKIGDGVIGEKNLSKDLLAKIGGTAVIEGKLADLSGALNARLADTTIALDQKLAAYRIGEGVVTEKNLAPEVLARITAASAVLRDGSVKENHLAPGLLAKAIEQSGIPAEINALRQEALTQATGFKGDIEGMAAQTKIRAGSVTGEKLARARSPPTRSPTDPSPPTSWPSRCPRRARPRPRGQGFRIVDHPESPNVMGGHPANKFEPGVVGSVVVGGGNAEHPNIIGAEYGTISGGFGNRVSGFDGAIGGGQDNIAGGSAAAIGGGFLNKTDGVFPVIGGGAANQSLANLGVISGGFSNKVTGAYAVIPGGYQNRAAGEFSLAAGRRANAAHAGSFVWADAMEGEFASTDRNQFLARASGGVYFYTNSRLTSGAKLNPGSGSWSMLSDRNAKRDLVPVDAGDILKKLASMPLNLWSYTTQADGVRHLGPTAQDFRAAFGLGEEDTHISAVDADGVALTAIQALNSKVDQRDEELRLLKEENATLKARLDAIERKLAP